MHLFGRNLDTDVAIVAEIGVNHEGNVDVAERLINAAADAGADAVKLQSYTPERFISAGDGDRLARVSKFRLDEAAHEKLLAVAKERGIALFSTAVTEDTVPLLARLFPAIKIASGDLDFEPVISAAAATGRPVIISTGNATVEEVDRAVAWCRNVVGDGLKERLVLMHCVASYPAPIDQANVRSVAFLRERYGLTTGYSNHVIETEAVLAAVALGAQIVEVHFTDSKSGRAFRDHSLSFEPRELAALVESIRRVRDSLGSYDKRPQPSEEPSRAAIRKGLVAARDLSAGTVLADADIMYARPATEFSARERTAVVGGTLRTDLKRGQVIPRNAVDVK
ncbi:MAG TPA: N-acetylneuraminate synthase family protein [Pseudolabrys sp.]|nr:N-acetylneuraminate synthase family protein [Pseudolabrys sp.]